MSTNSSPSKNSMNSPIQSKKLAFITKLKSHSFPKISRDDPSFLASNFELSSNSPSVAYTSLKGLLPKNPKSRLSRSLSVQSAHEIPISNFLVKTAAWAYLQPMEPEPNCSSNDRHLFSRAWDGIKPRVNACVNFINEHIIVKISHVFGRVLEAIHVTQCS